MSEGVSAAGDAGDIVLRSIEDKSHRGGNRRLIVDGENPVNAFHGESVKQQRSGQATTEVTSDL